MPYDYDSAYRRMIDLRQRLKAAKGPGHSDILEAMKETVGCLERLRRYGEAIKLQKELLKLYQNSGGKSKSAAGEAVYRFMDLFLKNGQA